MNANTKEMLYNLYRNAVRSSKNVDFRGLMEDALYEAQRCLKGRTSEIIMEHIFSIEFEEAAQKARNANQEHLADMLDNLQAKLITEAQGFILEWVSAKVKEDNAEQDPIIKYIKGIIPKIKEDNAAQ